MALQSGEDIYATLLTSDTYLPGALVLAHSLRDAGTSKKLAVLVTLDTVSAEVITQLKNVYDYVISVPRIKNEASPGKLHLMKRPDLHSAFTKINLWKQAQFRKIVYIDADVVAYRAPDELFDLPHAFAAAPDIGWPDLFNTGVMVLTPDVGEYYALSAMAQRGISFDGADQGLLNMHFKNSYHRLPFTYNVTPSAHYQYLPAYRHFQSSINMVHFIGPDKPWTQGRGASHGGGVYDEMVGQWWSVYDRHYRPVTPPPPEANLPASAPPPEIIHLPWILDARHMVSIQKLYRLLLHPSRFMRTTSTSTSNTPKHPQHKTMITIAKDHLASILTTIIIITTTTTINMTILTVMMNNTNPRSMVIPNMLLPQRPLLLSNRTPRTIIRPLTCPLRFLMREHTLRLEKTRFRVHNRERLNLRRKSKSMSQNDPQWSPVGMLNGMQPPPANAKPEAMNFPQTHYEMSRDATPFVPPPRYASPPRDMWYEVPKAAPAPAHQRPAPIFPWETHRPAPARVFAEPPPPPPPAPEPTQAETHTGQSGYNPHPSFQELGAEPSSMNTGSPSTDLKTEPTTPIMSSNTARDRGLPPSDPWASFTRTNAWDGVPQIERYVDAFQKQHRRVRSRGQAPGGGLRSASGSAGHGWTGSGVGDVSGRGVDNDDDASSTAPWRRGSKVTDFPSEVERPSLPVTPAPIRRPRHWGGGGPSFGADDDEDAAGGDGSSHLLPAADGVPQQVDWDPATQLQKLAKEQSEMLLQKLGDTEGGEGSNSPRTIPLRPLPFSSEDIVSPTYVAQAPPVVVSPKPIKPGGLETSSVRNIDTGSDEPTIPSPFSGNDNNSNNSKIAEPSYLGPGIVFEKDESYPEHEVAAALPSEEELDVLDT
ncbi:glycogenin glucosyltransferase [Sporothrix stenoceras]|uniref:Glycogenin glucosyltransferase n=1 Tax=Sporothrix stenoceras TaxID=5173 RepID=A0ABR3ZQJ2_9PEZI